MTVNELIEVLKNFPPAAPVCVIDWLYGWAKPRELKPYEIFPADDGTVVIGEHLEE